jgi:hypothetical protein
MWVSGTSWFDEESHRPRGFPSRMQRPSEGVRQHRSSGFAPPAGTRGGARSADFLTLTSMSPVEERICLC